MTAHAYLIFRPMEIFVSNNTIVLEKLPEIFSEFVSNNFEFPAPHPKNGHDLTVTTWSAVLVREDVPELPDGSWIRLRTLLASEDPSLAAYAPLAMKAYGLVQWHGHTRFCQSCGHPLENHASEIARSCPVCKGLFFPRLSPAVIVVVHKGASILLARHRDRISDIFTCIAGYLEHGENLEECVAREVYEETGIRVTNVRYAGSQSWPFPDQFMIGFHADYESGEITIDPVELLEARWIERDKMPVIPSPGTIAWRLIAGDLSLNACMEHV